jgi:hypothetical protein
MQPQTGDRGAVSKSRLVLDESRAEKSRRFLEEIALLIGVLCATHESDAVSPIYRDLGGSEPFGGNPRRVTCLPDLLRDPLYRVFPRDFLPVVASRGSITRRCQPVRRSVSREHGYSLHAQGSTIHNVVEVALHGYQLAFTYRGHHATTARAEVAGGCEFFYFRKFPFLCRCAHGWNVKKTSDREAYTTPCSHFEPFPTRNPAWTRGRFKIFALRLPYFVIDFTLV